MSASDHLSTEQFGWDAVQERHPVYSQFGMRHAVSELSHDGDIEQPLQFSQKSVRPGKVRFQRYPESDERVQHAMKGYSDGADMPPVLLVNRGGETLTADGHHRLSAAEILKRPVEALVTTSPHPERYAGRAKVGTLRKPR